MKKYPLNGVLLLDKEQSWTSHDCIAKLRSLTKQKRIGHAGTLDPLATGALVVLLGSATRLSDYLIGDDKEYEVVIHLGVSTDTDDAEGKVSSSVAVPYQMFEQKFAEEILASFLGDSLQLPPLYSSLKQEGKIAHREARKGKLLDIPPRPISLYEIHSIHTDNKESSWSFTVRCSKGTYIRALARDIGEKLAVGAHVVQLRRVKSGNFDIKNAHKLKDIEGLTLGELSMKLHPLSEIFPPDIRLEDTFSLSGKFFQQNFDKKIVTAYSYDERLLGFYERRSLEADDSVEGNLPLYAPKTIFPQGIQGPNRGDCVATLGIFDGVHEGHQALLTALKQKSVELKLPSTVITFDPLPEAVISKGSALPVLISLKERVERLKSLGIDRVIIIPFTPELAALSPQDFITRVLYTRCTPKYILVGSNFKFGVNACAGSSQLATLIAPFGAELKVFELEQDSEQTISSTRIRTALKTGDIETATKLLGRSPTLSGRVVVGSQLGRSFGYPTANLDLASESLVPEGIYAATTHIEGLPYQAAFFVGNARTDSNKKSYELHILGFDGDLYGSCLEVSLLHFIAPVMRYTSVDELRLGIERQIKNIQNYFCTKMS